MTTPEQFPSSTSDADLVLRTRSGDAEAFGELWSRHYRSGLTVARSMSSAIEPDDLVQEAYARIFQAIQRGGGPNGSFRAYLFTSIRNTAAAWGRARHDTSTDELDAFVDPRTTEQATEDALDRGLTAKAFRSLPSRWQEVLWYTEIEQMKPAEVAPLLGMSAGAVSQLAFRAREGLREAWIQAHLGSAPEGSECHGAISALGAHARGNLGRREQSKLEAHLRDCARCFIVAAEAKDVSERLALVMLPLVLGVGTAGAYLAALQAGTVSATTIAAMPIALTEGVGAAASGAANGAGGASGASATGSGAGGGAGGALGSAALIAGASVAAVVVAGVVAAASILPSLDNTSPLASFGSSPDSSSESLHLDAEVTPDPDIEPHLAPLSEEAPDARDTAPVESTTPNATPTDPEEPAPSEPEATDPAPTDPAPNVPEEPTTPETPGEPAGGGTEPTPIPQPEPEPKPTPEPTPTPQPEPEEPPAVETPDPDVAEPVDPEVETPEVPAGKPEPAEPEPEPTQPVEPEPTPTEPAEPEPTQPAEPEPEPEPAPVDPDNGAPGEEAPEEEEVPEEEQPEPPAAISEPIALGATSLTVNSLWGTTFTVALSGAPGEKVVVTVEGSPRGEFVLDSAGNGTAVFTASAGQMLRNTQVNFSYEGEALPETAQSVRLQSLALEALTSA